MSRSALERLTHQFYDWEKRARGWQVFDAPVDLEPPFEAFFHTAPPRSEYVDDGKVPGFFTKMENLFKPKKQIELPAESELAALTYSPQVDQKKILLVNLSKGHVGEDVAHILGALLISSISSASFSRVDTPEEDRIPFMVYMDEFHNFTTLSLVNMFSELRKFKVGMTLAHQYMHQLDDEIRHAILGNVGTLISFRVGAEDARG